MKANMKQRNYYVDSYGDSIFRKYLSYNHTEIYIICYRYRMSYTKDASNYCKGKSCMELKLSRIPAAIYTAGRDEGL